MIHPKISLGVLGLLSLAGSWTLVSALGHEGTALDQHHQHEGRMVHVVRRAEASAVDQSRFARRDGGDGGGGGCTFGFGARVGNAHVDVSLEVLTDVLAKLSVNVSDGLTTLGSLSASAGGADAGSVASVADGVTASIQDALQQVMSTAPASSSSSSSSALGQRDAGAALPPTGADTLSGLLQDATQAFTQAGSLVGDSAAAAGALQALFDGLTTLLAASQAVDPTMLMGSTSPVSGAAASMLQSASSLGLATAVLSKLLAATGGSNVLTVSASGSGPLGGGGGGLTVGPGGIGGGFNAGGPGWGVGGGFHCG